jgi:hypothetical protein
LRRYAATRSSPKKQPCHCHAERQDQSSSMTSPACGMDGEARMTSHRPVVCRFVSLRAFALMLALWLLPPLRAPRLEQLVLACEHPFHRRVVVDALDALF